MLFQLRNKHAYSRQIWEDDIENAGHLNIDNECDKFSLHCVYIPRIEKVVLTLQERVDPLSDDDNEGKTLHVTNKQFLANL